MRYWIIKGNPKVNDLDEMLEVGVEQQWRTKKPPKFWARGDRIFFWSSSPRLELVGLGELVGPTGRFTREGETLYRVKYLTGPLRFRIGRDTLRAHPTCGSTNFLKKNVAQGVLEVTQDQAREMYRKLHRANTGVLNCWKDIPTPSGSQVVAAAAKMRESVPKIGQGFGDSISNIEVERAAIRAVSAHFAGQGWTIRSVEQEKCGYDLECRRGTEWKHIEVKGIGGPQCAFILTAGELAASKREPHFLLVAVTNALTKPTLHEISPNVLREHFRLDPISFHVVPIARS